MEKPQIKTEGDMEGGAESIDQLKARLGEISSEMIHRNAIDPLVKMRQPTVEEIEAYFEKLKNERTDIEKKLENLVGDNEIYKLEWEPQVAWMPRDVTLSTLAKLNESLKGDEKPWRLATKEELIFMISHKPSLFKYNGVYWAAGEDGNIGYAISMPNQFVKPATDATWVVSEDGVSGNRIDPHEPIILVENASDYTGAVALLCAVR